MFSYKQLHVTRQPCQNFLWYKLSILLQQGNQHGRLTPCRVCLFFRLQFHNCISCVHNCDDQSLGYLHIILHSSNIWTFINSLVFFTFYRYITSPQSGQLPVGLISQLVEHCTGIADVVGSRRIPFRPEFLKNTFQNYLSCVHNCDEHTTGVFPGFCSLSDCFCSQHWIGSEHRLTGVVQICQKQIHSVIMTRLFSRFSETCSLCQHPFLSFFH